MDRNYKERPGQKARPKSLSARRAWIEIAVDSASGTLSDTSLSARRAWIEISDIDDKFGGLMVALRKESVDRNTRFASYRYVRRVALRKESVDRNSSGGAGGRGPPGSLSARRAWIEILLDISAFIASLPVALRKESVDRNQAKNIKKTKKPCRSPQGERG